MVRKISIAAALGLAGLSAGAGAEPPTGQSAPTPQLTYAFSVQGEVGQPVEQGTIDGGRKRFIPIVGGRVYGPRLQGEVLPGGGDWQTILEGGLVRVMARYFLKASDGTVIEIANSGLRVASPDVTERLARGENVDPSLYYFRTTPEFRVSGTAHGWLQRAVFVGRGIRRRGHVVIDFFIVE